MCSVKENNNLHTRHSESLTSVSTKTTFPPEYPLAPGS